MPRRRPGSAAKRIGMGKEAPRYLFHWTNAEALKEIAAGAERRLPIAKKMWPGSALYRCYPRLQKRAVLYAWSHPVTAMAGNPHLIYAGRRPGDARILTLELEKRPAV